MSSTGKKHECQYIWIFCVCMFVYVYTCSEIIFEADFFALPFTAYNAPTCEGNCYTPQFPLRKVSYTHLVCALKKYQFLGETFVFNTTTETIYRLSLSKRWPHSHLNQLHQNNFSKPSGVIPRDNKLLTKVTVVLPSNLLSNCPVFRGRC